MVKDFTGRGKAEAVQGIFDCLKDERGAGFDELVLDGALHLVCEAPDVHIFNVIVLLSCHNSDVPMEVGDGGAIG